MDVLEMIRRAEETEGEDFQDKLIEILEENDAEFYWFSDTCFFVVHNGFYRWDCDIQKLTAFDSEEEFLESLGFLNPEAVEIYKWEKEWEDCLLGCEVIKVKIEEFAEKLYSADINELVSLLEENCTRFHVCNDMSGDIFLQFKHDNKHYVVSLAESLKITEISRDDFEEHLKFSEEQRQ